MSANHNEAGGGGMCMVKIKKRMKKKVQKKHKFK